MDHRSYAPVGRIDVAQHDASPRPHAPAAAGGVDRRRCVLVVDDDETLRLTICEVVRRLGYDTVDAGDPEAALRMLESGAAQSVDAILSDVRMPKLSGPAFADIARQRWPSLKVVLMSGHALPGLDALYPLLCKPFGRADLRRAMASILSAA